MTAAAMVPLWRASIAAKRDLSQLLQADFPFPVDFFSAADPNGLVWKRRSAHCPVMQKDGQSGFADEDCERGLQGRVSNKP
jgi:hypothetical protein